MDWLKINADCRRVVLQLYAGMGFGFESVLEYSGNPSSYLSKGCSASNGMQS